MPGKPEKTPRAPNIRGPLTKRIKANGNNSNNNSLYKSNANSNGNSNNNMGSVVSEEGIEEADTVFPFSPEVAANFEDILQLKEGEAEHIIKYFKNDYEHGINAVSIPNARVPPGVVLEVHPPESVYPLSDFIYRSFLPGVKFNNDTIILTSYTTPNSTPNTIRLKKIGSGSYGNIFQDATGLVYKETQLRLHSSDNLELKSEEFYRNFLLEAFIQVVLQNENPSAVGNISGIYIDDRINTRKSIRTTNSTNAILEVDLHPRLPTEKEKYSYGNDAQMVYSCFITMGHIPYTFDTYAKSLPGRLISLIEAKRIFSKLGTNLRGFKRVGFKHGDFHAGNLMFDKNGNPIIIDFGMACFQMGTNIYSVQKKECESFDLLMLMASLYEFYRGVFQPNVYDAIGNSMKINETDEESIYHIGARMGYRNAFHAFYYDRMNSDLIRKIPKRLTNEPGGIEEFVRYWLQYRPLSLTRRALRCVGLNCFRGPAGGAGAGAGAGSEGSITRRRKSKKARKSRKAP